MQTVVASVLSIPDWMFLLLHLGAGSSFLLVEETSSLGVAGKAVEAISSAWPPSCVPPLPLLGLDLVTLGGWPSFWWHGLNDG